MKRRNALMPRYSGAREVDVGGDAWGRVDIRRALDQLRGGSQSTA